MKENEMRKNIHKRQNYCRKKFVVATGGSKEALPLKTRSQFS